MSAVNNDWCEKFAPSRSIEIELDVRLVPQEKLLFILSHRKVICELLNKYSFDPSKIKYETHVDTEKYQESMFVNLEKVYLTMANNGYFSTAYTQKDSGRSFSHIRSETKTGLTKKHNLVGGLQGVTNLLRNWFYIGKSFDVDSVRSQPTILSGFYDKLVREYDDDAIYSIDNAIEELGLYNDDRKPLHACLKKLFNLRSDFDAKQMMTAFMNGAKFVIPSNENNSSTYFDDSNAVTKFLKCYRYLMNALGSALVDKECDFYDRNRISKLVNHITKNYDPSEHRDLLSHTKYMIGILFLHEYENYISSNAIHLWRSSPLQGQNIEVWSHDGFSIISGNKTEEEFNVVLKQLSETLSKNMDIEGIKFVIKPYDKSPIHADLDALFEKFQIQNKKLLLHQEKVIKNFDSKTQNLIDLRRAEILSIKEIVKQNAMNLRQADIDQLDKKTKCFLDFVLDSVIYKEESVKDSVVTKKEITLSLYLACMEACAREEDIVYIESKKLWYKFNDHNKLWIASDDPKRFRSAMDSCFERNLLGLDEKNVIESIDETGKYYPTHLPLGQIVFSTKIALTSMFREYDGAMDQLCFRLDDPTFFGKLDMMEWMISVKGNKCLDAETDSLIDRKKEHYCTVELDYEYTEDPSVINDLSDPDDIDSRLFFEKIFPDQTDNEFCQNWLGYSMTASIDERCCLLAIGIGSNGKTAIAEVMMSIFKPYSIKLASEFMSVKNQNVNKDKGPLIKFAYRFAYMNEPKTDIAPELFKEFTEGVEIDSKVLYQNNPATIRNRCKLYICSNELLKMLTCVAIADRGLLLRMLSKFFDTTIEMNDSSNDSITNKFIKEVNFKEKITTTRNKQRFLHYIFKNGMVPYVKRAIAKRRSTDKLAIVHAMPNKDVYAKMWKGELIDDKAKFPELESFLNKMFIKVTEAEFQQVNAHEKVSRKMMINMLLEHKIVILDQNGKFDEDQLFRELTPLAPIKSQLKCSCSGVARKSLFYTIKYSEERDMKEFPHFGNDLRDKYLNEGQNRLSQDEVDSISNARVTVYQLERYRLAILTSNEIIDKLENDLTTQLDQQTKLKAIKKKEIQDTTTHKILLSNARKEIKRIQDKIQSTKTVRDNTIHSLEILGKRELENNADESDSEEENKSDE